MILLKLELVREVFQEKMHSVKYLNDTDLLIDNQIVFGTDGEKPIYKLKSAKIKIKEKRILLETSSMYNPWFGNEPNRNSFGMIKKNLTTYQFHTKGNIIIGVEAPNKNLKAMR